MLVLPALFLKLLACHDWDAKLKHVWFQRHRRHEQDQNGPWSLWGNAVISMFIEGTYHETEWTSSYSSAVKTYQTFHPLLSRLQVRASRFQFISIVQSCYLLLLLGSYFQFTHRLHLHLGTFAMECWSSAAELVLSMARTLSRPDGVGNICTTCRFCRHANLLLPLAFGFHSVSLLEFSLEHAGLGATRKCVIFLWMGVPGFWKANILRGWFNYQGLELSKFLQSHGK